MKKAGAGERNGFSRLLEQTLINAGIKNATLAEALNYDISYISKWVTGNALPSRKNIERVLTAVSTLVAEQTTPETRESMKKDLGVKTDQALRDFVGDSLREAYCETIGETSDSQYLHNANLRVNPQGQLPLMRDLAGNLNPEKRLDIAVMADLFSLDRTARLAMAGIEGQHFRLREDRPGINIDYLIDLDALDGSSIYDVILLIHMMTGFSRTNFRVYHDRGAGGKLLIAVKEEFAGLSMVSWDHQILCTTSTREKKRSSEIYDMIRNRIDPDRLIFLPTDMETLLRNLEYFRNLLSQDIRWLVGHITEHFLPEDLFDTLLEQCFGHDPDAAREARRAYHLTCGILEKSRARIMLYRLALADFIISGELDFFNHSIILEPRQRHRVLCRIRQIARDMEPGSLQLVKEGFSEDFKYITNPCMFLSESASYLRLENGCYRNNLLLVKDDTAREKLDVFFESIWNNQNEAVLSDHESILSKLDSLIDTAEMLS